MRVEWQPLRVVGPGRGLAWFVEALVLIRRQPARLMLIGLLLQLLMGLSQVGLLAFLLILAIPALSAGMMQVLWIVDHGARPPLGMLFVAFWSGGKLLRLFLLGALMLAGGMLAVTLVLSGSLAVLDPGVMARLEAGDIAALDSLDPALIQRLMLAMLAGLAVSGFVSYFAVPLVWFRDLPLGSAILNGLFGLIRNWRPFLVLGLLFGLLAVPAAIVTGLLFAAAANGSGASPLLSVIVLLVAVAYQLILFGAQYVSFSEVFGTGEPAGAPPGDDAQLVA
jgi:hypothetical protein